MPASQAGRRGFESRLPLQKPSSISVLGAIPPLGQVLVTPEDSGEPSWQSLHSRPAVGVGARHSHTPPRSTKTGSRTMFGAIKTEAFQDGVRRHGGRPARRIDCSDVQPAKMDVNAKQWHDHKVRAPLAPLRYSPRPSRDQSRCRPAPGRGWGCKPGFSDTPEPTYRLTNQYHLTRDAIAAVRCSAPWARRIVA